MFKSIKDLKGDLNIESQTQKQEIKSMEFKYKYLDSNNQSKKGLYDVR